MKNVCETLMKNISEINVLSSLPLLQSFCFPQDYDKLTQSYRGSQARDENKDEEDDLNAAFYLTVSFFSLQV